MDDRKSTKSSKKSKPDQLKTQKDQKERDNSRSKTSGVRTKSTERNEKTKKADDSSSRSRAKKETGGSKVRDSSGSKKTELASNSVKKRSASQDKPPKTHSEATNKKKSTADESKSKKKTVGKENSGERKDKKSEKEKEKKSDGKAKSSKRSKMKETFVVESRDELEKSFKAMSKVEVPDSAEGVDDAKESTESRHRVAFQVAENGNAEGEEEDYNYAEDFEDYEEDFEEEELPNPSQLSQHSSESSSAESTPPQSPSRKPATESGSQPAAKQDKKTPEGVPKPDSSASQRRSIQSRIDFSKASLSEAQFKALSTTRKREKEIGNLIEMDFMDRDVFDLAPIKDYEFYIQAFGKSNRNQVQTQTGDDAVERESQTEEVDAAMVWTQHPPTDLRGSASDAETKSFEKAEAHLNREIFNSSRFKRFIERSGLLISELLEEDSVEDGPAIQSKSDLNFSSGCLKLSLGLLAKTCWITSLIFSPADVVKIAVGFWIESSLAEDIENKGLVGIWRISDAQWPWRLLTCESRVECCAFSPNHSSAFFAGLADGSVVAWDLNEAEVLHGTLPWEQEEISLRTPTYNTSYQSTSETSVAHPIVAICTLTSKTSSATPQTDWTYQLGSLDQSGSVQIWTVFESLTADRSELDLGLRPGGKLKLIKSALVEPAPIAMRCLASANGALDGTLMQATTMVHDQERFFVGTDSGFVLSLNRQDASGPKAYQSDQESLSDVRCMSLSPFNSSFLLSGFSDGLVRIFDSGRSQPVLVLSWPIRGQDSVPPVTSVAWSPSAPLSFFVLYGENTLTLWDLGNSLEAPIMSHSFQQLICHMVTSPRQTHPNQTELIAFANDAAAEVHLLKKDLSAAQSQSSDRDVLAEFFKKFT